MFANGLGGLHFSKGEEDASIFVIDSRDTGGEKNSRGDLNFSRVISLNESPKDS